MTEETRQEVAPEVQEVQEQPQEAEQQVEVGELESQEVQETPQAPVDSEPDLSLDFPELPQAREPQPQPEPEMDYDGIVEDLANKLLAKQQKQVETGDLTEDDEEFISKKDLINLKNEWKREIVEEEQRRQQAATYIQQIQQQADQVKGEYVGKIESKLNSLGIDWESSPELKYTADALWKELYHQKAQQLQRGVLFAEEVDQISRFHWKYFSENFLKGKIKPGQPVAPSDPNLSLAGSSIAEVQSTGKSAPTAWDVYKESKSKTGKVDAAQALRVLTELSRKE